MVPDYERHESLEVTVASKQLLYLSTTTLVLVDSVVNSTLLCRVALQA